MWRTGRALPSGRWPSRREPRGLKTVFWSPALPETAATAAGQALPAACLRQAGRQAARYGFAVSFCGSGIFARSFRPGATKPYCAALQVGDEHGIFGALPFEIGRGNQAALKFLEPLARISKLRFGWQFSSRDEDAVKTSLPRIAVDFARDVFGDFARRDAILHDALVAKIHHAGAAADRSDGVRFARFGRAHLQRTEVSAVARRPFFRGNVHERDRSSLRCRGRCHEKLPLFLKLRTSGRAV